MIVAFLSEKLVTGDHGYSLFDAFRREYPRQYINAGVAEQNMIGMAAGLARAGFRPFVYGLSAFVPIRVIEQIKLDIAHDKLPVVLIGDGAGFVYSHLGSSHHSTEDISCTRAIPNLSVYAPADRFEMAACLELAYTSNLPVYLRIGKSDRGDVHTIEFMSKTINAGDIIEAKPGHCCDIVFLATGSLVTTAVRIASECYKNSAVYSIPFIKPINTNQIVSICRKNRIVIVLEEHSVMGGLGSVIAEISAEFAPTHVLKIGVNDKFSHHCGSYDYLLEEHELDDDSIKKCITDYCSSFKTRGLCG